MNLYFANSGITYKDCSYIYLDETIRLSTIIGKLFVTWTNSTICRNSFSMQLHLYGGQSKVLWSGASHGKTSLYITLLASNHHHRLCDVTSYTQPFIVVTRRHLWLVDAPHVAVCDSRCVDSLRQSVSSCRPIESTRTQCRHDRRACGVDCVHWHISRSVGW